MSVHAYSFAGQKQTQALTVKTAEVKPAAVNAVIQITLGNESRQRPQVKTRAAVRGGGRKPWKQKGTGRARAGTSSSPLWRGGGVVFGPTGQPRRYRKISKKVRSAVLASLLKDRADHDQCVVLTGKPNLPATKQADALMKKLSLTGSTVMAVTPGELPLVIGARNLAAVELTTVDDLNVADIARHHNVILSKAAFDRLTGSRPAEKPPAKSKPAPKARASKSPKAKEAA